MQPTLNTIRAEWIGQAFMQGVGATFFAVLLIYVLSRPLPRNLRIALTLFSISAIANAMRGPVLLMAFAPNSAAMIAVDVPLYLIGVAHAGLYLLVVRVVFEDRPVTSWLLAPAIALWAYSAITAAIDLMGGPALRPLSQQMDVLRELFRLGLSAFAMFIVLRGWRDDLMQSRRLLRWLLAAGMTAYLMMWGVLQIPVEHLGVDVRGLRSVSPFIDIALMLAMAAVVFRADGLLTLVPPAARQTEASGPSEASRQALARLEAAMTGGLWAREGLTIEALAKEVAVSERQLRRLINERLGHQNFSGYLNSYRIAAAQRALADPANAQRTITEIAFELGYASLGPFNRAFKEATGQTPPAFRKSPGDPPKPATAS